MTEVELEVGALILKESVHRSNMMELGFGKDLFQHAGVHRHHIGLARCCGLHV